MQHHDNFNSIGVLVLSLVNRRRIQEDSQAEIEGGLETVRKDYSPSFFHTLRKFDYFQKGEHFRTHADHFRGLDRCLLGREDPLEVVSVSDSRSMVSQKRGLLIGSRMSWGSSTSESTSNRTVWCTWKSKCRCPRLESGFRSRSQSRSQNLNRNWNQKWCWSRISRKRVI